MPLLRLTAISRQVASLTPGNKGEHREILTSLKEVRQSLHTQADPNIVETLDGAILLMTFMLQAGELGGREILGVVVRLLEYVQGRLIEGVGASVPGPPPLSIPEPGIPRDLMQTGDLKALGDMQLGEILIKLGHLTAADVNAALQTSHAERILFGEAVVWNKAASESQVREALQHQEVYRLRGHRAPELSLRTDPGRAPVVLKMKSSSLELEESPGLELLSDIMLGEILLRSGSITRDDLDFGLKCQRASGQRLGESLVGNGATNWERVGQAIEEQKKLRRSA